MDILSLSELGMLLAWEIPAFGGAFDVCSRTTTERSASPQDDLYGKLMPAATEKLVQHGTTMPSLFEKGFFTRAFEI